tara:strand:- start:2397 stop:2999 length:603 start_codon:yes stop_codon:yes gene_type:complete
MKFFFSFLILLLIFGCNNTKQVYWCGDHPCINKKEKEAYFKKTMIVEIKEIKKGNKKKDSEIEKILNQAKIKEKKRIKNEKDLKKRAKLEEKKRIKYEKQLAKQAKLEEKKIIKEQKKLSKQAKFDEKRRIKEEEKLAKRIKEDEKKISQNKINIDESKTKVKSNIKNLANKSSSFENVVNEIKKRNSLKPYPEINDIPN